MGSITYYPSSTDGVITKSWPTDVNGKSLGPVLDAEGNATTVPQDAAGNWTYTTTPYANGDNPFSTTWVVLNIIDGASHGVPGSVTPSWADYRAFSGTQSLGSPNPWDGHYLAQQVFQGQDREVL